MSPTKLTLRKLRAEGYRAEVVEHWNHFAKVRKDLFGFVDVIGIRGDETIAVQATTFGNRLSRKKKILESDALADVLSAGWTVVVYGWRKVGNRWQCVEEEINV